MAAPAYVAWVVGILIGSLMYLCTAVTADYFMADIGGMLSEVLVPSAAMPGVAVSISMIAYRRSRRTWGHES
jgi:hypothetical protein